VGFIRANRKQQVFFGYSLDEFVPADAKCRFVVELVAHLDLRALYADYSDQGGDAFDPGVMLASWFLAYTEGVTSTRELEQRCLRDMHFIYVSGNLRPDHTSLSRFRQRHLERLPDLFVQIVRLAQKRGLSQFRTICIDGTRLRANASAGKSLTSEELKRNLGKIRSRIAEFLRQCELCDAGDTEQDALRQELSRLQAQQKRYEKRLAEIEKRGRHLEPKNRKGHRINLTDPDAQKMKNVNGARGVPGYSGQVSVDAESGLIVAAEAVTDANDSNQFCRQHAKVEDTLGEDTDRTYVADSGYHTLDQLEYIDDNRVDATIDDPQSSRRSPVGDGPKEGGRTDGNPVTRSDFVYDPTADQYICPMGRRLAYRATRTQHKGKPVRIYRTSCKGCNRRTGCTSKTGKLTYKRIYRDPRERLAERMAAKANSEAGKVLLNRRFSTVEPAFGNMKENLGFRGVRLRGIAKVSGEFILMCLGHNLNRLQKLFGCQLFPRPSCVGYPKHCLFRSSLSFTWLEFVLRRPHRRPSREPTSGSWSPQHGGSFAYAATQ
jgi:transposase